MEGKKFLAVMLKSLKYFFIGFFVLILLFAGYFFIRYMLKEPLKQIQATEHKELSRESCISCHEPIANEWDKSYHLQSITGVFMKRFEKAGFQRVFNALEVECLNCHAPANVLDVEHGKYPTQRNTENELGVDCVSCHVSKMGIVGPGNYTKAPHEVLSDKRFKNGNETSTSICATCHDEKLGPVVEDWEKTKFAKEDISCVTCHMPEINAPIVTDGVAKLRRSHDFKGDKDFEMLKEGLNATLNINEEREAVVQIVNDRVGHSFPAAGLNTLIAQIVVYDQSGKIVETKENKFKRSETVPNYLDFWPFYINTAIPYGETRNLKVKLPKDHGKVSAKFSYRDWPTIKDKDMLILELTKEY